MMRILAIFLLCVSVAGAQPSSETQVPKKSYAQIISAAEKHNGFFNFYYNAAEGKIWLEIDRVDQEFLYLCSLPAGIGSNDIGLDRGQMGESRVVKFVRSGPRLLLEQLNYGYRALGAESLERKAVEDSFAQSVLWGFPVAAEEGGHVLVDATEFFLQDAHHVSSVLKATGQGSYRIDSSRSALYLPRTRNFPQNTEVETILTFATEDAPGDLVRSVVPAPQSITVREHHSFVQLPDSGYRPRAYDPRGGFFDVSFSDFASPVGDPLRKHWIVRHRLVRKDPTAAVSEAVKPIVYYVDSATPEPIRSALVEGAQWWNTAFEAAGFKDAFQVKLLPPDADPMDVRYNVIQWVHRSTRGWSYGNTVIDPRTGEIIKGQVSLGSLRVRQDYLIAEGLLAPYEDGKTVPPEMLKMALARIRQLSAHEVGHTLGLSHNYIASISNRASVMDYPQPLVKIKPDGSLDLSDAYAVGIGEWDKVTINFGYREFPPNMDERAELRRIITDAAGRGLIFLTDQDARPAGSVHPQTHLWDNGTSAVDELDHILQVRKLALDRFSIKNIRDDMPVATLEEVLVPVYYYHRYQVEAAAKVIGGVRYTYALRGDGQKPLDAVPPEEQNRAIDALLKTLSPEVLAVPDSVLQLIPPHPDGFPRTRESFPSRTGMTFDPLAGAESAADMTLRMLLFPERAARLVEFHARDPRAPGFDDLLSRLISATWKAPHGTGYPAEIRSTVDLLVLGKLAALVSNPEASGAVRSIAYGQIESLYDWLERQARAATDSRRKAHYLFAMSRIRMLREKPDQPVLPEPLQPPDGPPIGSFDCASH